MRIAARLALQCVPEEKTDQRKAERAPVAMHAMMRAIGYHGIDVIVSEISALGFTAEVKDRFPPQSFVRLKLPGIGSVYAEVVWSKGGRLGGKFVTPIAPARLQRTLGFQPVPA